MNSRVVSIVVITCLVTMPQFCRASASSETGSAEKDFALRVYLPREVTIEGDALSLGRVCILRGKESLVTKASEIALGRISVLGQEIVVDRPMVLSRLACNGIDASEVTLTGAEKVTVKQRQQIINGRELVELASSFLGKNLSDGSVCQLNPIRIPTDLIIPGASKDIKLFPHLAMGRSRNRAKVQITVLADGKEIGVREVGFRLKYNCRRAVTLAELGAGSVISPENVKIEKTLSSYPEPANWRPPYGLVAKRRIAAKTVLRPDMVGLREPVVIVGRNQTVVIRLERGGLLVTAIGKTMQDGRAGECIKVRNVDSHRIIFAKVNEDGTVEPVF
jgi:flagella basal body P-ring formation protein FlgA